jgi:hypothetical protein
LTRSCDGAILWGMAEWVVRSVDILRGVYRMDERWVPSRLLRRVGDVGPAAEHTTSHPAQTGQAGVPDGDPDAATVLRSTEARYWARCSF